MNIHQLDGCAPAPLAHYLKALGILRLVAEQVDPEVRGWWRGDRFYLVTKLDRDSLENFFLEQYEPTPFVSPWNKGSGFYYQEDPGLTPFELSSASRGHRVRSGIAAGRSLLDKLVFADELVRSIKDEAKITKKDREKLRSEVGVFEDKKGNPTKEQKTELKRREDLLKKGKMATGKTEDFKKRLAEAERKFKQLKTAFIPRIRLSWRGPHREWMDAAMVLDDDGTPRFPALLGTGGNDGRLDFTNNFLQRFSEVFDLSTPSGSPRQNAHKWLHGSLWGYPINDCQSGSAVGQYLPGMAGGANSDNGPDGNSLLNPLDFILMMEGAILFTAHATRRMGTMELGRAAAPFAVNAHGAGYASASAFDESARGEQWMPLWSHPMTLAELRRLLSEGRAQIGARSVREPLDLARAVARLGNARGISAFQRYGYIERNGQSNLAVPIGRVRVPDRISLQLACLDDIDRWLLNLHRGARDKKAPARLQLMERLLSDALFAVTQHPEEPLRWQSVLLSLADVESVLRTGTGHQAGPIPSLRPEWVSAADDGSTEFRLALAFAMQSPFDSIRRHWIPLDKWQKRFATAGTGSETRLESRSEVVMNGRNGVEDAIAILRRRLIEASQSGNRKLSLLPAKKTAARSTDLAGLLSGQVDIDRVMRLARAMMALDGRRWKEAPCPPALPKNRAVYPDDAWMALRLVFLPYPLPPEDKVVPVDPAIIRRLEEGDASTAVKLVLQRLQSMGIRTTIRVCTVAPQTARLWAAALAFPVNSSTANAFLRRLDPNSIKEKTA